MHDYNTSEWGRVYDILKMFLEPHGAPVVFKSSFAQSKYPFQMISAQDYVRSLNSASEFTFYKQTTSVRQ